jgi:hypothetical protein
MMHADPKTLVLAAVVLVAVFEALRRLNDGHVRGMESIPIHVVEVADGPGVP